jgi:hypothetical protein
MVYAWNNRIGAGGLSIALASLKEEEPEPEPVVGFGRQIA